MIARTTICALALLCCACNPQPPSQTEVEDFVRHYAAMTRADDPAQVMALFSRDPGVSSVGVGKILKGYDAIQTATKDSIAHSSQTPLDVGAIDVTPLAADTVLAVFPFTLTLGTKGKTPVKTPGAGTIILKRTKDGLRVMHEHYSLRDA